MSFDGLLKCRADQSVNNSALYYCNHRWEFPSLSPPLSLSTNPLTAISLPTYLSPLHYSIQHDFVRLCSIPLLKLLWFCLGVDVERPASMEDRLAFLQSAERERERKIVQDMSCGGYSPYCLAVTPPPPPPPPPIFGQSSCTELFYLHYMPPPPPPRATGVSLRSAVHAHVCTLQMCKRG